MCWVQRSAFILALRNSSIDIGLCFLSTLPCAVLALCTPASMAQAQAKHRKAFVDFFTDLKDITLSEQQAVDTYDSICRVLGEEASSLTVGLHLSPAL